MAGSRLLKLAIVIYAMVSPATAQIADSTENFLDGQIAGFLDSLVVAEISSGYDIVLFIIIPFLGLYGITLYLTRKAFQMAEDNFSDSTYGTSDLSDQAKKSTQLIAVAISAVTVSQFGGVSPVIALILGLIGAIFLIWQFWGAFQTTRHRGGGGATTTTTPDTGGGPQDTGPSRGTGGGPDRGRPGRGGPDTGDTGGGPQSGPGEGGVPGGGQMGPHMAQMMQMQGINMNQAMMEFMRLLQGDFRRGSNGNINIGGSRAVSPEAFEDFRQAMHDAGGTIGQSTMMDIIELLQQRGASGLTDELLEEIAQIIMDPETEEEVDVDINNAVAQVIVAEIQQAVESGNLQERDCVDQFIYLLEGEIFPAPDNSVNLVTEGSTPNTHLKTGTVKTFFQEINSLSEQEAKTAGGNIIEELASGPEELNEEFLEHIVSSLGDWLNQGNKNRDNNSSGMPDNSDQLAQETKLMDADLQRMDETRQALIKLVQHNKEEIEETIDLADHLEACEKLLEDAEAHSKELLNGNLSESEDKEWRDIIEDVHKAKVVFEHFEAELQDLKQKRMQDRAFVDNISDALDGMEEPMAQVDNYVEQLMKENGPNFSKEEQQAIAKSTNITADQAPQIVKQMTGGSGSSGGGSLDSDIDRIS